MFINIPTLKTNEEFSYKDLEVIQIIKFPNEHRLLQIKKIEIRFFFSEIFVRQFKNYK